MIRDNSSHGQISAQEQVDSARTTAPAVHVDAPVSRPLIQARLLVGAVDDPHEREADEVAAAVVQRLQRQSTGAAATPPDGDGAERVQRRVRHRAAGGHGGWLDDASGDEIAAARAGGTRLDGDVRQTMESGFGADFSRVRIHHDRRADVLSSRLQARAFTTGSDIFFGRGSYDPGSSAGQELLAHELTHVIQQGGARVAADGARTTPDSSGRVVRRDASDGGAASGAGAPSGPDAAVLRVVEGYVKFAGETSKELSKIFWTAAKTSPNWTTISAGVLKITAGALNIATAGLSAPLSVAATAAVGGATLAAGIGEASVQNYSKRSIQGRQQRSRGGQAKRGASDFSSETAKGVAAVGAKEGITRGIEASVSAIPILGGVAQIALGFKSIKDAMDHTMAKGLLKQEGELKYHLNAVEGSLTAVGNLLSKGKDPGTRATVLAAESALAALLAELRSLEKRIKKVVEGQSIGTKFKRKLRSKLGFGPADEWERQQAGEDDPRFDLTPTRGRSAAVTQK